MRYLVVRRKSPLFEVMQYSEETEKFILKELKGTIYDHPVQGRYIRYDSGVGNEVFLAKGAIIMKGPDGRFSTFADANNFWNNYEVY